MMGDETKKEMWIMQCLSIVTCSRVLALVSLLMWLSSPAWCSEFVFERLEFRDATLVDVARILSEASGENIVVSSAARDERVTVFIRELSVEDAIDTICKVAGLWYRKDSKSAVYRIMGTDEYQEDIIVYREDDLRIFPLRHYNVTSAARAIETLFGNRVRLQLDRRPDETGLGGQNALGGGGLGGNNLNGVQDAQATFNQQNDTQANVQRIQSNNFGNGSGQNAGEFGVSSGVESLDLSPSRLQALARSARGVPGGGSGDVSVADLVDISNREPIIYVTTSRLHNLVMVRTSDEAAMREIGELLSEIDRSAPQVLLELEILELIEGDGFRSAFDADFTSDGSASGPESGQPRNPLLPTDLSSSPISSLGLGNFPLEPSTLIFQWMNDNIRVRLQLLESENKVKVLGRPLLLASNNTPSRLFIGEERVLTTGVTTTTSLGSTGTAINLVSANTEVRDIGNELAILPRVNDDGTVTLTIRQNTSSVLEGGAVIPVSGANGTVTEFPIDSVNSSTVEGTFLAADGLTVAIGGMIRQSRSLVEQKVPLLGDIPILGFFFKRKETQIAENELVLLITPRVNLAVESEEATREVMPRFEERSEWIDPEEG